MTTSIDLTKNVSADFGAFNNLDVIGLGFDFEVRLKGDHKGVSLALRLGPLWIDANVYSIHHAKEGGE